MADTRTCERCEQPPPENAPWLYECKVCKQAVCEHCRDPEWTGNEKRWICASICHDHKETE